MVSTTVCFSDCAKLVDAGRSTSAGAGVRLPVLLQVVCTGKEQRLLDYVSPQDFPPGMDYAGDYDYKFLDYLFGIAPAPPQPGLLNTLCESDDERRLAVICRRFEITGADLHLAVACKGLPKTSCRSRCTIFMV